MCNLDFLEILSVKRLQKSLEIINKANLATERLDGWFYIQEFRMNRLKKLMKSRKMYSKAQIQAKLLEDVLEKFPLKIRNGEIFAGTEDDAFSKTYALINPNFKVEAFEGYCDVMAVYNDITINRYKGITAERVNKVRKFWAENDYTKQLSEIYSSTGLETKEVAYFVEQVTGHTICDFGPALKNGLDYVITKAKNKKKIYKNNSDKVKFLDAVIISLNAAIKLSERYSNIAEDTAKKYTGIRRKELQLIARTCKKVPKYGAENLYEAIQSFMILWMVMNIEQAPNPYAFSVGNLDRILQPFYAKRRIPKGLAVEMMRHLLALYNVGDRNWAISQNIIVGGRDEKGNDLTSDMTEIVLDAFFKSNNPQPNLSVKLHNNTPKSLYKSINRFFFTVGHSTPSLFNDDKMFAALKQKGIETKDLKDYGIGGCQEPMIMGKESGNTTNSWLNLAKILELTLNNGSSLISGEKIGLNYKELGINDNSLNSLEKVKTAFYKQLDYFIKKMIRAANDCTKVLSGLPVPFLSAFMGGVGSGIDIRDFKGKGSPYNGSGCLIHGMAVVSDSFTAIKYMYEKRDDLSNKDLIDALRKNFRDNMKLRAFLLSAPKYGNNDNYADIETVELCRKVTDKINKQKNIFGCRFNADWSTPSTHLLYGYWVGATPDGRFARERLNYGLDPSVGAAKKGLLPRVVSLQKLPLEKMYGGYAYSIGLEPDMFSPDKSNREEVFRTILDSIFGFNGRPNRKGGFYAYFNVCSADIFKDAIKHPEKYNGVFMARIHGTFVNLLDLSPAIQDDIIKRLDPPACAI